MHSKVKSKELQALHCIARTELHWAEDILLALLRSIHSVMHKVARCTHCVKPQCTGHNTWYVFSVTVCIVCRKSVSQFVFQCVIQFVFQF